MRYEKVMRDIFEDIFANQPLDPTESARRSMRPQLRRRFYDAVSVTEGEAGFAIALDGRPVRTPARRALAAPARALADLIAEEWRAQSEKVDPATMPLTRLANSIIDGVADTPAPVMAEVAKFLSSDLVFYRAPSPEGLVARQTRAWDPLIDWARDAFGARFVLTEGLVFVAQPDAALAAMRAAMPRDFGDAKEVWRAGALHSITTLTGSALIALAVLHGRLSADEAWAVAHVDEDWTMDAWGRDELALERRAARLAEMQAAVHVLETLRERAGGETSA
jgi:chaperone required for assembly of F1-ATPase